MTQLIIGAIDNYEWSNVRNWAKSIRATGYDGRVVLIAYRYTDETVQECNKLDIELVHAGHTDMGHPIQHNVQGRDTQCHQMRFFHAWQYLMESDIEFSRIVMTDVRDVIFQLNPFTVDIANTDKLWASSESITYGTEAWNADNLRCGFGEYVLQRLSASWKVFNVGVLMGPGELMRDLFSSIYNYTVGRYIPSDQSAYNLLLRHSAFRHHIEFLDHDIGWACQCGTTLDPEKEYLSSVLLDPKPLLINNVVFNSVGTKYTIVHQYDRVPTLNTAINKLYE